MLDRVVENGKGLEGRVSRFDRVNKYVARKGYL